MSTTTSERVARLRIDKGQAKSTVNVFVPRDIGAKEFAGLHEVLVNKVIRDLSGCPCLSGAVDVLFQEDFVDVLRVNLKSGDIMR